MAVGIGNDIVIGRHMGVRLTGGGAAAWWSGAAFSGVDWRAIYQPYGAMSLAASYANLANPGTNDAAPGVAPTFGATIGWRFNGTTQYLLTGIKPTSQAWSALVLFRNALYGKNNALLAGRISNGVSQYQMYSGYGASAGVGMLWANGQIVYIDTDIVQGAQMMAGAYGYLNGVQMVGPISDGTWNDGNYGLAIGARNFNGTIDDFAKADILAIAIAASTLSETQRFGAISGAYHAMRTGTPDVYIVAGQSNASGRGTNYQAYDQSGPLAYAWSNANCLIELADPVDSNAGQADSVSDDSAAAGSCWPLLATQIMAETGRSVVFVPCAMGGTSISAWQPGADHEDRSTLYGSMNYRAQQAAQYGTLRGVLWWQGETDALASMTQATYNSHLDTLANAVMDDLGVPLMPCKLQNSSGIADAAEDAINDAIAEAWSDNANVVTGPDLSDIASDDNYHLQTDLKLGTAASRWFTALNAAVLI